MMKLLIPGEMYYLDGQRVAYLKRDEEGHKIFVRPGDGGFIISSFNNNLRLREVRERQIKSIPLEEHWIPNNPFGEHPFELKKIIDRTPEEWLEVARK